MNAYQAHILKAVLDSEDIESFTTDENIAHHLALAGAISDVILFVRNEDEERALEIVSKVNDNEYGLKFEENESEEAENNIEINNEPEKQSAKRRLSLLSKIAWVLFVVIIISLTSLFGLFLIALLKKNKAEFVFEAEKEPPEDFDYGDEADLKAAEQGVGISDSNIMPWTEEFAEPVGFGEKDKFAEPIDSKAYEFSDNDNKDEDNGNNFVVKLIYIFLLPFIICVFLGVLVNPIFFVLPAALLFGLIINVLTNPGEL